MNMTPQQIYDKLAAQLQAGQFGAASKLAKSAFKKYPKVSHFANVAGTALASSDKGREALPFFVKALKLEPNHEEYQNNLVHAYIVVGNHDKVEELVKRFARNRAEPSKLYHLQAFSADLTSRDQMVVEATTKGLETATQLRSRLLIMRAKAYDELRRKDDAMQDYLRALEEEPNQTEAIHNLAQLYLDTFQADQALTLVETSLAKFSGDLELLHSKASVLSSLGRVEESNAIYLNILDRQPDFAPAILQLSQSVKGAQTEDILEKALTAIENHPKGTESWCQLSMAIGNLQFGRKDFKAAGSYLTKGNQGLAKLYVHHQDRETQRFERSLARTPKGRATDRKTREGQPMAIFVLGQPRSGTTLTEMVLSAHPEIASCGELGAAAIAAGPFLNELDTFDAEAFEDTYRNHVPKHALGNAGFVDKMPANYRHLGFILHGIAGAKVIHIERDPREVGLSMWRQIFGSRRMRYAFDLKHIAQQANLYRRYMNHWKEQFGDQFITVRYDDLVQNIEAESKRMAAFCEIEWVEAMMAPQKNKAQVRTASVRQVREGVHKKSLGGWRALEKELQPLIRNLDKRLWPELDL